MKKLKEKLVNTSPLTPLLSKVPLSPTLPPSQGGREKEEGKEIEIILNPTAFKKYNQYHYKIILK
jgi:hypothetical protein